MNIRAALESDLASLAELLLLVHRMHVEAQPGIYRDIALESAQEFLAARLTESNAWLRVAEINSEVQGYCSAAIRSSPSISLFEPVEFLYVNEIIVRPARRRRGVGRALLADLKAFACEKGVTQLKLDVGHFNAAARAFFRSQGFEVLRESMSARVGE